MKTRVNLHIAKAAGRSRGKNTYVAYTLCATLAANSTLYTQVLLHKSLSHERKMLTKAAFVLAAATGVAALAAPTRLKKYGRTTKSPRERDVPDAATPGRVVEAPGLDLGPVRSASITARHTATLELADGRTEGVDTRRFSQRVDEEAWLKCRSVLDLTASEFDAARDKHKFSSREDVLKWQAGAPRPKLGGAPIEYGRRHESSAVKAYAKRTGNAVASTGLWTDASGRYGASPDGLVTDVTGEEGLLEVKCLWSRRTKKQLAPLTKCPNRYFAQIQRQMEVCDYEWCDLVLWVPQDVRILRVPRDRAFWVEELGPAVAAFSEELGGMRASLL